MTTPKTPEEIARAVRMIDRDGIHVLEFDEAVALISAALRAERERAAEIATREAAACRTHALATADNPVRVRVSDMHGAAEGVAYTIARRIRALASRGGEGK